MTTGDDDELGEDARDRIDDLLDMRSKVLWNYDDELEHFKHANADWWATEALNHPRAHRGCCKTCGCATTCMFWAFFEAVVSSTLRELDRAGLLKEMPKRDERTEDEVLNDPFGLWGTAPSYRCYVSRHKDCEPEGAEKGCTCSCGHQEPVCACGFEEAETRGEAPEKHDERCPKA